jgi:RNA polymerase sigma factor (sigma-70 family)
LRTRLLRTVLRQVAAGGPADAELLRRFARDRDEAAFAEIVRRYARLVWGVCRNLLADESDAEDAFQATFLALVRSADKVRDGNALGGWLHGVAVRVCQKARRSAARRRARERAAAAGEAAAPVADAAWEALLAAVHEEVCRLPDEQRVPFVLCCLEGHAVTAAAARLGWKLGTLSGRLTRAKQAVLARLAKRGIAPGVAAVAATAGGAAATTVAPARLVERVLRLGEPGGAVSESVLHLSQGVTHMALTKTKLLAAAAVVAAAVGASVWSNRAVPTADAQHPQQPPQAAQADAYRSALANYYRVQGATSAARPAGAQWEYKYVQFGDDGYEKKANELGKDGWEMVAAVGQGNFFFKRPKPGGAATTTTLPRVRSSLNRNAPGDPTADGDAATELIPLKNGDAARMANTLAALFDGRLVVSAEERSNALILKGPAALVKEAKELIEKLDALPGKGTGNPRR